MTTKPKFKSDAFGAIHASASALHRVGAIEKATMRKFDESCFTKSEKVSVADLSDTSESHSAENEAVLVALTAELHRSISQARQSLHEGLAEAEAALAALRGQ